jgi:cell division protein ZapA (FtsZ GTPase activity inhibitor)
VSDAVKVTIGGHELLISSEHSAEYTREVAAYYDAALARLRAALPTVDAQRAAILAGLAVTDELFQARQGDTVAADRLRVVTEGLARLVPPAKRGKGLRDPTGPDH